LSLAGLGPVPSYREAIGYALARGALVVAAAGNCFDGDFSRCTPPGSEQAPAWLPHVVTVGATDGSGAPAGFSIPSARWVDLAAPGELVTTLWPTQNNPYLPTPGCMFVGTTGCYSTGDIVNEPWGPSGTSFATAMVSGAAAILFGANPRLRPEQVAALLRDTARPAADPRAQIGAGQLDIAAALERVKLGSIPPADYGEPNDRSADATRIAPAATIRGTLDWQDDPEDVYHLVLRSGDKVSVNADGAAQGAVSAGAVAANCKTRNASTFVTLEFRYLARCPGAYLLRLTAKPGAQATYRLTIHPS
jgi:subtilisin family serine protease